MTQNNDDLLQELNNLEQIGYVKRSNCKLSIFPAMRETVSRIARANYSCSLNAAVLYMLFIHVLAYTHSNEEDQLHFKVWLAVLDEHVAAAAASCYLFPSLPPGCKNAWMHECIALEVPFHCVGIAAILIPELGQGNQEIPWVTSYYIRNSKHVSNRISLPGLWEYSELLCI